MRLLARVAERLRGADIRFALIGAGALAAHGVSRSTVDLDLLATDLRCLDSERWADLRAEAVDVEIRRGDVDDPLRGMVRFHADDERDVDLVVGGATWQEEALQRATLLHVGGLDLPVVQPADLILLKLYAGGAHDVWDIQQLLDDQRASQFVREVETRIASLPERCRELWRSVLSHRQP